MLVDSIVCLAMRTTPKWSGPKLLVSQIVSIFVDCSSWFTFHWSFHRCCRCHCRRRRLRFEQVRSSLTLPPPRFWNRIRNHFRFGCKRLCLPCHYRYRGSLVICQTHSSGSDLHLSPALSFSLSHTHIHTNTHLPNTRPPAPAPWNQHTPTLTFTRHDQTRPRPPPKHNHRIHKLTNKHNLVNNS